MPAKPSSKALATTEEAIEQRLGELIPLVNAGNERAPKELHDYCLAVPALWERRGSLEHTALESWKKLFSPGASNSAGFTRDHIDAELSRRRKQLRADGDSQLETLLINPNLSAWLQVMHADAHYAQMQQRDGTIRQMEYATKRLDRAQWQLLRAIHALATVRRLLRPMQVNIRQNQFNVAQ